MSKKFDDQNEASKNIRKTAIWVGVVVIVFWVDNLVIGLNLPNDERGILGDTFGAVNALFSGLAFVGLIYAILLQRQEIRESRVEIEKQQRALELQSETMVKQQFEASFFAILNRLENQSTKITTGGKDSNPNMFRFFTILARRIIISNDESSHISKEIKNLLKQQNEHFPSFFTYRSSLSSLFIFLEKSMIPDKLFYANLILASFSTEELLYHYLTAFIDTETNLKHYFEKYSAFQIFEENYKEDEYYFKFLKDKYSNSAFENN